MLWKHLKEPDNHISGFKWKLVKQKHTTNMCVWSEYELYYTHMLAEGSDR